MKDLTQLTGNLKKYGMIGAGGLLGFVTLMSSFTTVGSGDLVRIQNTLTGSEATWAMTEGVALKMPYFSTVTTYPQEGTIAITDNEDLCDTASICASPRQVGFADTYGVTIEASFRYSLPRDAVALEKMHDKVKNRESLFGTTLLPFSQDLINFTASQFRAEDFMQGGQNEFKSRMIDQATNGLLVTRREKIIVESEQANRDSDRDSGGANVGEQFRYQVTVLEDKEGNPKRNVTAINAYNITIVPAGINLVDYAPEPRLRDFMTDKQDRVRARAKIVEDQENERQMAITAQLTGDRERIQKQNILLQAKDAAKIAGEKAVLTAKLEAEKQIVDQQKVADLAVIDKTRELQVSKANEGIQKANSVAAKYEASAIKEVGFAQAEVKKADYAAIDKTILALEVDKAKALAMYQSNMTVNMPTVVTNGGNSGSANSLEMMTTLSVMEKLGKSASK
jgi:hypothetical protein